MIDFPNVDDNVKITNNIVWDINVTGTAGSNSTSTKSGIRVFQTNSSNTMVNGANSSSIYYTPRNKGYHIKNTYIANNTIKLDESNAAIINGISLTSVGNTTVFNNAIAIKDAANAANDNYSIMKSCLHYQGQMPSAGIFVSDRNVFEIDNGVTNGTIASFMETNDNIRKS